MFQEGPGLCVLRTWSVAAKLLRQCGHRHDGAERQGLGQGRGWAMNAPPLTATGHLRERLPSPQAEAGGGSSGGAGQSPGSLTPPVSQGSRASCGPHPQSPEPTRGRPRRQRRVLGRQQAPATEGTAHPLSPLHRSARTGPADPMRAEAGVAGKPRAGSLEPGGCPALAPCPGDHGPWMASLPALPLAERC